MDSDTKDHTLNRAALDFLCEVGSDGLRHSDASLFKHLSGTASLLADWGAPDDVVSAGLCHAIYGTERFEPSCLNREDRPRLQAVIGRDAEALVYDFGTLPRDAIYGYFETGTVPSNRLTDPERLRWLAWMLAANWIEQRERCPKALRSRYDLKLRPLLPHIPEAARAYFAPGEGSQTCSDRVLALMWTGSSAWAGLNDKFQAHLQRQTAVNLAHFLETRPAEDGYRLRRYLEGMSEADMVFLLSDARTGWMTSPNSQFDVDAILEHLETRNDPTVQDMDKEGLLPSGVQLDFESPTARSTLYPSHFRTTPSAFVPFSPPQKVRLVEQLVKSEEILEKVVGASALYKALALQIVPRIDSVNASFRGSSNRSLKGRLVLYNPHAEGINAMNMALSLLHESIHMLLYMREHDTGMFLNLDQAHHSMVVSPFSGARVHLLALVHAVFVWFGVYQAVDILRSRADGDDATLEYYAEFCRRGFASDTITRIMHRHRDQIEPSVLQDMADMNEIMSRQY